MAWNHFFLNKVTNVTATLQSGGNLDPNTTYYVKVLAIAKTTDTRQTSGWINLTAHYSGEWSDTIMFTTTSTERSVLLQWDKVYKHSGVEVEGYDVLVSKDGNFPHHGKILRAPDYVQPTTSNNYYLLDANPNYYYRYVPYGFPYLWWSGSGTATLDNLYDYMKTNITNYERWIQVFKVPNITDDAYAFAYNILGCIVINRSTDDITYNDNKFTFQAIGRAAFIWGTFQLAGGKVKVIHSVFFSIGPGHSGGNNFFAGAADGSILEGTSIWAFMGSLETHFTDYTGRVWGGAGQATGKTTALDNETFFGNILDWVDGCGVLDNAKPRDVIIVGHPDKKPGFNFYKNAPYLYKVLNNLSIGALNNLTAIESYCWNPCDFGGWAHQVYLQKSYCSSQGNPFYLVDWYFKDSDYGYTLYPRISLSSGYLVPKFFKFFLAKTIRIKVLDENGNPIAGAKVYFLGPNEENLAISNLTTDCVSFIPPQALSGYNYDANNQNPTYDTTNLWVKYYTSGAGQVISQLEAGQEYFVMGERIKVIRKIEATPPATNWQLYEVERGVSGIRKGWICGSYSDYSYSQFLRAKPYHTTDSNGECWNVTMWADYRMEVVHRSATKYIKDFVTDGTLSEQLYLPIKIKIEDNNHQTYEFFINYNELLASKNDNLQLVVKLPDQIKFLMPMGKEIYKNLKPSDSQNKIFWLKV